MDLNQVGWVVVAWAAGGWFGYRVGRRSTAATFRKKQEQDQKPHPPIATFPWRDR